MQATLLGFAIALILALVAALVGPHFVDWNDHRSFFEAKAGQLIGLPVRIAGDIDASILPFPAVALGDITVGAGDQTGRLRARSLRLELGLGSLMRGEVRAVEMRLVEPQFDIGLDGDGRVDGPAIALATETLSIDRLSIENGRATLADARSRTSLVLDQLWFDGEVRSLTGPFRGKGAFVSGGGAYGYTVAAGRRGPDGNRVRLTLETAERPLLFEADGTLAFDGATPSFDGSLTLARQAGSVLATGRAVGHEPWQLSGKVKTDAALAKLEEVAFRYGPEDRAANLTGAAEFEFGRRPRLRMALSTRQLDLDRILATPDVPRHLPFPAIRAFGEMVRAALWPSWPVTLSVGVDVATLGGASLQNVTGELRSDGKDWRLDRLELRAPGFTQVKMSGRLDSVGAGLGFSGDTSVESGDPRALVAWLAGRAATAAPMRPWQAKGVMTLAGDRIVVDRLQTEFGRGTVAGRVAYFWPEGQRPARLDAVLKADELDVDAVVGFGESAFSGLGLERPREADLAIEIGHARIAGHDARNATVRLKFDADGIAIERLSVADFGGATIDASGRIQDDSAAGDRITVDLDARDVGGVAALADRYLPIAAAPLRRLAGHKGGAKLRATVYREPASGGDTSGRLDVIGRIGAVGVNILASATGKPESFALANLHALSDADVRLGVQLDAEDGGVLLRILGLDRVAAAERRPGRLVLTATGPLDRDLRFDGKLDAGTIDAEGEGAVRLPADRPAVLSIDRFGGRIGGNGVSGRLAVRFADTPQIDGAIEANTIDAAATVAALIGMPAGRDATAERAAWSSEPFAARASDLTGRLAFKVERAAFSEKLVVGQLQGVAKFGPAHLAFEDVRGELGQGNLEGRLELKHDTDGLSARLNIALGNAKADTMWFDSEPPVRGRFELKAEIAGSGRSPAAFIGSLSGQGTLTLEEAQIAGLNPDVFGAVLRATELGIPTEGNRIREFVAGVLEDGSLPIRRVETAIRIAAGQVRIGTIAVPVGNADAEVDVSLDLIQGTIDALLALNGQPATGEAVRPVVRVAIKGALREPTRSIDTVALSSWLTLRAVEQQSRQIDAMERARRELAPPQERPAAVPDDARKLPASEPAPPLPPPVDVPATPRPGSLGAQN